MASAQAIDALGTVALAEMYKDLKDNRNVHARLTELVGSKLAANEPCNIEEFMTAAESAEGIVIRFYRKLVKLMPNRFQK